MDEILDRSFGKYAGTSIANIKGNHLGILISDYGKRGNADQYRALCRERDLRFEITGAYKGGPIPDAVNPRAREAYIQASEQNAHIAKKPHISERPMPPTPGPRRDFASPEPPKKQGFQGQELPMPCGHWISDVILVGERTICKVCDLEERCENELGDLILANGADLDEIIPIVKKYFKLAERDIGYEATIQEAAGEAQPDQVSDIEGDTTRSSSLQDFESTQDSGWGFNDLIDNISSETPEDEGPCD